MSAMYSASAKPLSARGRWGVRVEIGIGINISIGIGGGVELRVEFLGNGVVEGAEVHRVGRLPSKVVFHPAKHTEVEGLGEV